jgi:hypothetical protein
MFGELMILVWYHIDREEIIKILNVRKYNSSRKKYNKQLEEDISYTLDCKLFLNKYYENDIDEDDYSNCEY